MLRVARCELRVSGCTVSDLGLAFWGSIGSDRFAVFLSMISLALKLNINP
jgi:hypothetical protein